MPALTLRRPESQRRPPSPLARRRTELGLLIAASVIVVGAYVLMVVGNTDKVPSNVGPLLGVMLLLGLTAHVANRIFARDAHPALLPLVFLLNGLGYVMLTRIDLGKATHYAPLQAAWTAFGIGVYVLTLAIVRHSRDLDRYRYLLLAAGALLLLLPLSPIGRSHGGARLWVAVGTTEFQPVEIAKILLCVFFASYFVERRELLTIPTARIGNRLVVDPRPLIPITFAWLFAIAVMSFEHDIGFSALLFTLFIGMLWVTTGRTGYLVFGLVLFAVGAYYSSRYFSQVHVRVESWINPWTSRSGGQLQEAWWALGSGGLGGSGLGLGQPWQVPVVWTDFIFAAFGEEMGLLGSGMIVAAFLLLVGAGLRIAQVARSEFAKLTAAGLTIILGMQAFFIMAGIVRILPLTGITLPFVSYGGSALVANYMVIAILMRISDEGTASVEAEERRGRLRAQQNSMVELP